MIIEMNNYVDTSIYFWSNDLDSIFHNVFMKEIYEKVMDYKSLNFILDKESDKINKNLLGKYISVRKKEAVLCLPAEEEYYDIIDTTILNLSENNSYSITYKVIRKEKNTDEIDYKLRDETYYGIYKKNKDTLYLMNCFNSDFFPEATKRFHGILDTIYSDKTIYKFILNKGRDLELLESKKKYKTKWDNWEKETIIYKKLEQAIKRDIKIDIENTKWAYTSKELDTSAYNDTQKIVSPKFYMSIYFYANNKFEFYGYCDFSEGLYFVIGENIYLCHFSKLDLRKALSIGYPNYEYLWQTSLRIENNKLLMIREKYFREELKLWRGGYSGSLRICYGRINKVKEKKSKFYFYKFTSKRYPGDVRIFIQIPSEKKDYKIKSRE